MDLDFLLLLGARIAPGLRDLDDRAREEARGILAGQRAQRLDDEPAGWLGDCIRGGRGKP